jgi:16S rRNA (guanine966-N2)-methyltransferase
VGEPGLRIIGGTWKGRRLWAPPGLDTRPMPDRIKQSLFDWLGQDCTGWRMADVCAGSGGVGLEAASRGATEVVLVEPGHQAQGTLAANLAACGNPPTVRVAQAPFQQVLPTLRDLDVIFADPPFPWFPEQPALLSELMTCAATALGKDGCFLLRGESGQVLPPLPTTLLLREQRAFGRSWIAWLARA